MNIAVVGTGYVGLVTGTCFAEFGVNVSCVDVDTAKISQLREGKVPIFEPGLEEMVRRNLAEKRLSFTTDLDAAVKASQVIFIAVGTPQGEDGAADLSFVRQVARGIARSMKDYKVVVTKSTVPMGTGAMIRKLIREEQATPVEFSVASNPEFLREGSAIEDFMRPNRVVIGADDPPAIEILKELYNPLYLIEAPFLITTVISAEMIKYASNAFLATKISFINDIAHLCEKVGADVHDVAKGMGLDHRIGRLFLHPGPGYGGSCFPKDTLAILKVARENGVDLRVIRSAVEVNDDQVERMVRKIEQGLGALKGKKIGVLGLSFKPNTSDIRESPAMRIITALLDLGASVRAYDPVAMPEARTLLGSVEMGSDAYDTATGCDALVLATEWNQFRNLDLPRLKELMRSPVLIDLRNVYEPGDMARLGFRYAAVGR
ncbi:MAG TPA: UDP-glucose/GDP-mannose dehydrogenase family protein [Candidatus Polarisedimenticolia bacterium]|jgi:UDPglucose 6-dehydrogenase|nr:UDP-glucose/GDP-mannose dehydrogenase family protein [Candidatus Polarisedimenticolia bacterium]